MNYESVILEMLTRIQTLEQQVKNLMEGKENIILKETGLKREDSAPDSSESSVLKEVKKIGTKEIREYIKELKEDAFNNDHKSLTLVANDIHKSLGLNNRMPLVCNAMRQSMGPNDQVIHETPSGYSSTLEIMYKIQTSESNA